MKIFLTLLPLLAFAAPQGLQIISGSAEIVGSEVRVTESSVLHWDSYSIAAHEHIHYPASHATLNRVTSELPSEIYGRLSSNGPLWLINPNGIVIGENGRINAASFLASTLDLLDGPEFVFAGDRGRIEQHGVIECPGGYVTLMSAESVVQTGEIHAEKVAIGVGREILFTPKDSPLIAIRQSGLEKPGFAAGIQCKGLIEATGLEERDGEVYLIADRVVVEKESLLRGDDVRVLGKEVAEFYGEIEAPGGFAEVSGKELKYRGKADLRAEDGTFGTLLLDPVTVTISIDPTMDATIGAPTNFSADTVTINNADLQAALGMGNVEINARDDMMFAGDGSITWSSGAGITWGGSTWLHLTGVNVTLGSAITSTSTAVDTFVVDATGPIAVNAALAIAGSADNDAIRMITTGAVAGTYSGVTVAAAISSSAGNITMTGQGGPTGNSIGISMTGGSISISDSRTLTLTGTGGGDTGGASCHGISFTGGTFTIGDGATGATAILTGIGGGGTGGASRGIILSSGLTAITMNGASKLRFRDCVGGGSAGGGNTGSNYGVQIGEAITNSTAGAEITFANITGGGIGTGSNNYGLFIDNVEVSAPTIQMETEHSVIGIRGGNASGTDNTGIRISGASGALGNSMVTSEISLIGSSLGTGSSNYGIQIGGSINIADGGTLTLHGTGGVGTAANACNGIDATGGSLTLGAGATAILTGIGGGGTGGSNRGVRLVSPFATTMGASSKLLFTGCTGGGTLGGGNSSSNQGVVLNTPITTAAMDAEIAFANITGGGLGTGSSNNGLWIFDAEVSAPIIRMDATNTTNIRGGVGSGTGNTGIRVGGAAGALGNSMVTSEISLIGSSLGTGSSNHGIHLEAGSINIADGGTLTLSGTAGGGASSSSCMGISLEGGTLTIGSTTGATAILTGIGGGGTGGSNRGVNLFSGLTAITMNGTSALRFLNCTGGGTAGGGNSSGNYGVYINEPITASAGEITFANITGGGSGTGNTNYGLFIDNVEVSAPTIEMGPGNTTNIRGGVGSGTTSAGMVITNSGSLGNNSITTTLSLTASNLGTGTSNHGIWLASGSINIADDGTLTLDGTGGMGTAASSCFGIFLGGGTLTVGNTTGATAIFTGVGGGGTGGTNYGVNFASTMTAVVVNGASTLHFTDCVGGGTAGGGNSSNNYGVFLNEAISLTAGEILFGNITGGGIGTGANNHGLVIQAATVAAPSIKMDSEMSIIRGGISSGNSNTGILIQLSGVLGSNTGPTATSEITLKGGSLGTGTSTGISIPSGSINIADGGTLTLNGTGGGTSGSTACHGISLSAGILTIGNTTGATAILTGVGGGGSGSSNRGVTISTASVVMNGASKLRFRDCTGGGALAGGVSSSSNYALFISGPITATEEGAEITFANIVGGGTSSGSLNHGLFISGAELSAPTIRIETEYSAAEILSGNAGSGNGIFIDGGGALGNNTVTQTLSLVGRSRGSAGGADVNGIKLGSGSINIADGGTLTLHGIGGNTPASGSRRGIYFAGGTLTVGSTTGATAILTGEGGGSGGTGLNHGVSLETGMTAITLNGASKLLFQDCAGGGKSSGTSGSNYGVHINKAITTSTGEIAFANITGGGLGTGGSNYGLFIDNVEVSAPIIHMDATNTTNIRGGVGSGTDNTGIRIGGATGALGSNMVTSEISLVASSLGTGSSNYGVHLENGSINIADDGTLTLHGTGGMGTAANNCHGINFAAGTLTVGNSTGATTILTGVGGGGTGGTNVGVYFQNGMTGVTMNGASKLRFRDCTGGGTAGGGGSFSNLGVQLNKSVIASASNAEITFANITGGGIGSGPSNYGLFISGATEISAPTIQMEAGVDVTGIRGGNSSGGSNFGVFVFGASAAIGSSSFATNISLTAGSLGTGPSNTGFRIDNGGKIQSALGGTITLNGTGGNGTGSNNHGILVTGTNSAITTATGAISLTGTPGNASTADAIRVESSGTVQSTGAGIMTLDPTGSGAIGLGSCALSSGAALNFNGPVNLRTSTAAVSAATTATFTDTINGAFAMNVSADTIDLQGIVGGTTPVGTLSLTGTTAIQVANNISTNNANLTFTGPVALTGDSTMATSGGAIHFTSTLDGAQDLTLNAGAGTITFGGIVGGTVGLGTFEATASNVFLNADITAVQGTFDADVTVMGDRSLKKLM